VPIKNIGYFQNILQENDPDIESICKIPKCRSFWFCIDAYFCAL